MAQQEDDIRKAAHSIARGHLNNILTARGGLQALLTDDDCHCDDLLQNASRLGNVISNLAQGFSKGELDPAFATMLKVIDKVIDAQRSLHDAAQQGSRISWRRSSLQITIEKLEAALELLPKETV